MMIVGIKLLTSAETLDMIRTGSWALGGGLLSGALAVALQPAFEGIFHLATPSRLLEITNPNHPLMKRLMIEAPGTYHHSIIVANLAEAAADKIGANSYLARAGA
jgi:membrane-associated HD superfamily phosphohydrolase